MFYFTKRNVNLEDSYIWFKTFFFYFTKLLYNDKILANCCVLSKNKTKVLRKIIFILAEYLDKLALEEYPFINNIKYNFKIKHCSKKYKVPLKKLCRFHEVLVNFKWFSWQPLFTLDYTEYLTPLDSPSNLNSASFPLLCKYNYIDS